MEYYISVLAALSSILAGGLVSSKVIQRALRILLKVPEPKPSYAERLTKLTSRLSEASAEVDSVLSELAKVAADKESTVMRLEHDIDALREREVELREKIQSLSKVPLPVADRFAELMSGSEKRKTKRDYILFGTGVLVTTVIGIVIQLIVRA